MTLKQRYVWCKVYVAFIIHNFRYLHTNARGFANITVDYEEWMAGRQEVATVEPFEDYEFHIEE